MLYYSPYVKVFIGISLSADNALVRLVTVLTQHFYRVVSTKKL